ncbi:MAG: metallophosphoesterase [Hydrocarboniphaga sp.]|nr:metallophosphoesterase [Hydrocarboniphaga sp.]
MKPGTLPSVGEDLVVLAGDIATGVAGIQWAKRAIKGRPVVYVLGNHEFYGQDFDDLIVEARAMCAGTHVHFLENGLVDLAGYRILGCTLWTDFQLLGADVAGDAAAYASVTMADYSAIRRTGRRLSVRDTVARCHESRAWLSKQITASTQPLLVITHHAPSFCTMNPMFEGQISNAAFHNGFDDLIRPPVRAWIHGHNHYSISQRVNEIPVVTNQRGYPNEDVGEFRWDQMIDLV